MKGSLKKRKEGITNEETVRRRGRIKRNKKIVVETETSLPFKCFLVH
jgi:hypothetical protein